MVGGNGAPKTVLPIYPSNSPKLTHLPHYGSLRFIWFGLPDKRKNVARRDRNDQTVVRRRNERSGSEDAGCARLRPSYKRAGDTERKPNGGVVSIRRSVLLSRACFVEPGESLNQDEGTYPNRLMRSWDLFSLIVRYGAPDEFDCWFWCYCCSSILLIRPLGARRSLKLMTTRSCKRLWILFYVFFVDPNYFCPYHFYPVSLVHFLHLWRR